MTTTPKTPCPNCGKLVVMFKGGSLARHEPADLAAIQAMAPVGASVFGSCAREAYYTREEFVPAREGMSRTRYFFRDGSERPEA